MLIKTFFFSPFFLIGTEKTAFPSFLPIGAWRGFSRSLWTGKGSGVSHGQAKALSCQWRSSLQPSYGNLGGSSVLCW